MRQKLDYWSALTAASESRRSLASKGISLRVTVNDAEVHETVEKIGKSYLTPWLDPVKNDFTPDNYFWLIASREEAPVIVGGGRLDVVGNDAAGHLHRAFSRGYGPDAVAAVNPEVSARLRGRLCYLGDLFSRSGAGLSQTHRRSFLVVANYIASQHFKADCTYSFMRMHDVKRGSADINGLDKRVYHPLHWGVIPQARDESEIIVYREARDDQSYFDIFTQELEPRVPRSRACHDGPSQEVLA
ncbi:hypothetical protein VXL47_12285 [Phaeobacter sp. JH20_30]|uniref:hypothetical protein n=1 Tax=unclassified Phaeobacter TaxID=2621772 RepID=UPI003A8C0886